MKRLVEVESCAGVSALGEGASACNDVRARIEEEDFALPMFLLNNIDEAALIPGDDMVGVDFYCVVKDSGLCYNGSGLCYYGMVSDLIASVSVDLIYPS